MADDLPTEFDLVVIGTGFTESCIAAAASRVGKTVLHIDRNEFYGGVWASLNLESLIALLSQGNLNEELKNASYKWHIPTDIIGEVEKSDQCETIDGAGDSSLVGTEEINKEKLTQAIVLEQSRHFNIDLCPKLLFSTGSFVKLLVSSNICRYAEFRALDHVCTCFNGELLNVPCSRSDVFNSKDLSVVEKRMLMKVLNDCLVYGEEKHTEDELNNRGKTFRQYLTSQKVTEKIAVCVMQAIAMCNDDASYEVGMERIQHFLKSLGRYGNTPFLFPMYGCGEMPQCFCRLCAVFGGIYCLNSVVHDVIKKNENENNEVTLIIENHKGITAKHVVSSHGSLPEGLVQQNSSVSGYRPLVNSLSRGIVISSSPLGDKKFNCGGGGVNLLRLTAHEKEAIVIQLSQFSGTCPKNYFIFHITAPAESDDPAKDLQPFMDQIFNDKPNAPNAIFSAFFHLTTRQTTPTTDDIPIYYTAGPYYELDYERSLIDARNIFSKLYPNDEFLPRAPDPEEIVVEGEDPRALNEIALPADLRAQLHELERSAGEMDIDGNNQSNEVQQMDTE